MRSEAVSRPREGSTFGYTLNHSRYLNLTNRCNLRCRFCPRAHGDWTIHGNDLRLEREPSNLELLRAAAQPTQYREVVFCGLGEPTLRLNALLSTARRLRHFGAKVRLDTNGLGNLHYDRDITADLEGVFDSVSVSLNAPDAASYAQYCRPRMPWAFAGLLDFLRRLRDRVPEVVATAIDGLPGIDIAACRELAGNLGVGFRARRLNEVVS
jgi:TatD DNase family protein